MFGAIPYKTKQFFFVLIKLSIVVGAFYFIYHKLTTNKEMDLRVFWEILSQNNVFSSRNVVFLIVLSIFNWFFEIIKWKHLAAHIKEISFYDSLKQCLGSLTASLLTPNRVGEYGVKAMFFKFSNVKKVVAMNLLGNSLQMFITTIFGVVGLSFFLSRFSLDTSYYELFKYGVILMLIVLFPVVGLVKAKLSYRGISFKTATAFYSKIPISLYFKGFLLSLLRYFIFSFQFYFLLTVFGVKLGYFESMIVITSMYFLASIIPVISIFDMVLKGSVAVYLFSIIGVNNVIVLSVVLLMWLLNVVLPSLVGAIFVLRFKLPKRTAWS